MRGISTALDVTIRLRLMEQYLGRDLETMRLDGISTALDVTGEWVGKGASRLRSM